MKNTQTNTQTGGGMGGRVKSNSLSKEFTCIYSVMDGFIYRPSTREEAEEILSSLRER